MPAVRSGKEYAIPFNKIHADNLVEEDLPILSDRLTRERHITDFTQDNAE